MDKKTLAIGLILLILVGIAVAEVFLDDDVMYDDDVFYDGQDVPDGVEFVDVQMTNVRWG